jgi:hypothetical protein
MTEGRVSHADRDARTIAVRTVNGSEETYRLADYAAKAYIEEAGHKANQVVPEAAAYVNRTSASDLNVS